LRSEEQRLLGKKRRVQNTVKEQQMDLGVFYVPIPDIKEYNMYGDEDLFLHEAILDIIFKSLYNRKTNLYLKIQLVWAMVKDGPYTQKV
jgi:hypothetical protein